MPAYVGRVRIERKAGPDRLAFLPAEDEPVTYGVHGEIAAHYGLDPAAVRPHASTIDHLIGATAGCLAGTLGGALVARGIALDDGRLTVDGEGEVFDRDGTLVLESVTVRYRLRARADQHDAARRAHDAHIRHCPVARSLQGAIDVRTELELVAEE